MTDPRDRALFEGLALDWGALAPLRIRARAISEGLYGGLHRSRRKGSGVEFAGQRPYVPGDDLRFVERRSLLRHDRLMLREFETETERVVWSVLDASASMAFRSARGLASKQAYASLLAAGLCRVALAGGDPVGLAWLGGVDTEPLAPFAGRSSFDRVLGALERARAGGDASADPPLLDRALSPLQQSARRKGSVVVVFSDLLDLPEGARETLCGLGSEARRLVVVRVLDPLELDLGLSGGVRLRSLEGGRRVETDADTARAGYLQNLEAEATAWAESLEARGGTLWKVSTGEDPGQVLMALVGALATGSQGGA